MGRVGGYVEIVTLTKHDLEQLIAQTVRATVTELKPNHVPPILSKAQVAEYLGKTTATIDRYMREGIPFRKIDGGHPEFYKSDIDNWLRERFQTVQGQANNGKGQELV